MSDPAERDELLLANQAFYDAHETRDLDAMSELWVHDDTAVCVHPGWPFLRGWASIRASWQAIFSGPGRNQFILTNVVTEVVGAAGWITLEENLVDRGSMAPITATNVFRRVDGTWRLVVHHSGPVMTQRPTTGE